MRRRGLLLLFRDLFLGIRFGYPPCCIAHYLWDGSWGWPSGMMRWLEIRHERLASPVPCGVFHSGGSELRSRARLKSIVRVQARLIRPFAGRSLRHHARDGADSWRAASMQQREAWGPEGNAREYWRGMNFHLFRLQQSRQTESERGKVKVAHVQ